MIVGGGTLLATGLCWYALPRIVGRPLASNGLAQCAFWFTAVGLPVFYIALVGERDRDRPARAARLGLPAAKAHMGKWYKVPIGIGAGVMGLGYWCFAANVFLTVFQSRLVRVPKPQRHLWKFFATGAAALTVGTVQGVIQVQPAHADWLYRAGHAGEWIDPISHAHINLVTGLTMLVAGALFALAPQLGGTRPRGGSRTVLLGRCSAASLAFYGACLYLGFHEGGLVVGRGLTPEQAEEATPLHAPADHRQRRRHVRRVLAPARDARPRVPRRADAAACVRARRLRARSRSGRCRGPCRRCPRSTSCSIAAARPAT